MIARGVGMGMTKLTNEDLLSVIERMSDNAPLTEDYRRYWQASGGYIDLARARGMGDGEITQRWHLLEAWAGGENADNAFTVGNLNCCELLLYIGEMLQIDADGLAAGVEAARQEVEKRWEAGERSWTSAATQSMKRAYLKRTGRAFVSDVREKLASCLEVL